MVIFNDFFSYCIQQTNYRYIKLKANLSCRKSKRSPQRSAIAKPRSPIFLQMAIGIAIAISVFNEDRDCDRGHTLRFRYILWEKKLNSYQQQLNNQLNTLSHDFRTTL